MFRKQRRRVYYLEARGFDGREISTTAEVPPLDERSEDEWIDEQLQELCRNHRIDPIAIYALCLGHRPTA